MLPPADSDIPPPVDTGQSARVEVPEAPSSSEDVGASKVALVPVGAPVRRARLLQLGALTLVLLGLVASSTWWFLSRQADNASDVPGVPKDTVALINSSTPIALKVATGMSNMPGELAYAPDTAGKSAQLLEARRAQDEGRYSSAISQYAALVGGDNPGEARDALWGLASTYAASGQDELAIRAYTVFAGLKDPRAPAALFRLGELYRRNGRPRDAIGVYAEYARLPGPARHAVQLLQAGFSGNTPAAEDLYRGVLADKPEDPDLREAFSAWADLKSKKGDHAGALQLYDRLASERRARPRPMLDNNGVPAQVLAAAEAVSMKDNAGARKRLLDYVKEDCPGKASACSQYPYGRNLALDALVKIDPSAVVSGTISPMQAANIAYSAGSYDKAIQYLNILRVDSPKPAVLAAASLLTGRAFSASGDPASAYNWYTDTVRTYPSSPEAPAALRRIGDMLESQAEWDAAMSTYSQTISTYPASEESALARLHCGVLAYRLEQRDVALALLRPLTQSAELSPTIKTQADFWTAKLQKASGDAAWKSTLAKVSSLSPVTFLDFRARSLLAGEAEGGPVAPTFTDGGVAASSLAARYEDEGAQRAELLDWTSKLPAARKLISSTTGTPAPTVEPTVYNPEDPETLRALALLDLGYADEVGKSLRAVAERLRNDGDAPALARLAIYLRYHAPASTALDVAEILQSMDAGDPLKEPVLLLKTLYPTPYSSLVMDEAKLRDLDPLIVFALVRQESRFVPDALSHADARGLAQVIPSTAQGIADQLGDTHYAIQDLYLPYVSIRYGTYYLASNLPAFDRKLLPTLAAYNGGPGNAARWLSGSALFDPDLYLERIDLFETGDYIEQVYLNYGFYRRIYAR